MNLLGSYIKPALKIESTCQKPQLTCLVWIIYTYIVVFLADPLVILVVKWWTMAMLAGHSWCLGVPLSILVCELDMVAR